MNCVRCDHLTQVLASRREGYVQARAAAYYRVSTELAARKQVDMERAKTDHEEHRLACHRAPNLKDSQSVQLS